MENFLKNKYNLHNSSEVKNANKFKTGEKASGSANDQIQNYLERLEDIIDPPKLNGHDSFDRRERNLNLLKEILYRKFVVKPEEIPEAFFENQKRIAREQGHGDIEITDDMRNQHIEVIISDQKSSLDNWIDYISSPDKQEVPYPSWLKYWAIRSILGMGEYDKEKKKFTKRSKGTTKPFPDLNREALAYVLDSIKKKYNKKGIDFQFETEEEKRDFEKILQGENFSRLYAWAIEKVTPASQEALANTEGEWIEYEKGSDHIPLVQSLQGHGTGWCTAGETTAKEQLKGGDFYVYYSKDEYGQYKVPRVAIRMENDKIAEVRGIAPEQNLDPYIGDIVKDKLQEFPDGEEYEKKTEDMKKLTEIEMKIKNDQELTKEELIFIYEIEHEIDGFGYKKDPRIIEIKKNRDAINDLNEIFNTKGKDELIAILKDSKKFSLLSGILSEMNGLDYETAMILIRNNEANAVGRNAASFDKNYHNEIIQSLINFKSPSDLVGVISNFSNLNFETAMMFVDNGLGDLLVYDKRLDSFAIKHHNEIALKIIENGNGRIVAQNLSKFTNHNQIALSLIENNFIFDFEWNIRKFKDLNYKEVLIKWIKKKDEINHEVLLDMIDVDIDNYNPREINNRDKLLLIIENKDYLDYRDILLNFVKYSQNKNGPKVELIRKN